MRARSGEEAFADHIIKNAHIINDTVVNTANFGAAILFEDFGLFL